MSAEWIGKSIIGYVVVAIFSQSGKEQIGKLLDALKAELPDVLWAMPPEALHITLCEIILSLQDYTVDKNELFEQKRGIYEDGLKNILSSQTKISINFNGLEASPKAIIIRGSDDGSFQKLRKQIIENIPLPEATKPPPNILHASIARYLREVELSRVKGIVNEHSIDFREVVEEFRLIKSVKAPLLEYETLQLYKLKP